LISLAGALLPALDAARVPACAGAQGRRTSSACSHQVVTVITGSDAVRRGARAGAGEAHRGDSLAGYASIACLLVGGILLMPWMSRLAFERLPASAMRRTAFALALAQLARRSGPGDGQTSPRSSRALSLMVAMAIMVASFRESVDRWLAVAHSRGPLLPHHACGRDRVDRA
jgi:putative ABC transport system permease protein